MEATARVRGALDRLKGVFLEVPGTSLSVSEAARLSGLEQHTCRLILGALEHVRFLNRSSQGLYTRRVPDAQG